MRPDFDEVVFENFKMFAKETVESLLSKRYADLGLTTDYIKADKPGDSYDGLIIPGEISPVFDIDRAYEEFRDMSDSSEDKVSIASAVITNAFNHTFSEFLDKKHEMLGITPVAATPDKTPGSDIIGGMFEKFNNISDFRNYMDYDKLRSENLLLVRLSNAERSKDIMEKVPCCLVDDLVMTFHVNLGMTADGKNASCIINNQMFKEFQEKHGIDVDDLKRDAIESAKRDRPAIFMPVGSMLNKLAPEGVTMPGMDELGLFVVSNDTGIDGASALFYPGVFEEIEEKLGSGFFCIPSSRHEFLVISDKIGIDVSEIKQMIMEINRTEVSREDYLSDELYHYDPEIKLFESVSSYRERIAEKKQERSGR